MLVVAFWLLVDALCVATVTLVLARSKLFQPLRTRLAARAHNPSARLWALGWFLHGLLECTFCTSIWVALSFTVFGLARTGFDRGHVLAAIALWPALVALASPLTWLVYKCHASIK